MYFNNFQNGVTKQKSVKQCINAKSVLAPRPTAKTSKKAIKQFVYNKYKAAFKIATKELLENQRGPNCGKRGYGSHAICNHLNRVHKLDGENGKKLKPQTIQDAVDTSCAGMSPLKAGWPQIIPKQFTKALANHATMKQVTVGDGKASGCNTWLIIKAMTNGTDWVEKFMVNHAWRRVRADYPEHFVPSQAKDYEDC